FLLGGPPNSVRHLLKPSWSSPASVKFPCTMALRNSNPTVTRCSASGGERCLQRLSSDRTCAHWIPRISSQTVRSGLYSTEVYTEVVIAGAGKPGATAVSKADWLHVWAVRDTNGLAKAISRSGLGAGEVSTVLLAKEMMADLTLIDERKGRQLAIEEGLAVVGCVGILEELCLRATSRTSARPIRNSCARTFESKGALFKPASAGSAWPAFELPHVIGYSYRHAGPPNHTKAIWTREPQPRPPGGGSTRCR